MIVAVAESVAVVAVGMMLNVGAFASLIRCIKMHAGTPISPAPYPLHRLSGIC